MARLKAGGGYGLWRLLSNHCLGETREWGDDSRLKDAKISSNSDMVEDVKEAIATSTFTRHWEVSSSLEMTSLG